MSKARDIVETLRTVLVDGDVTNANFTGADLEISKGGTGASSTGAARTALGVAIGTDVLAPDGSAANLTNLPASGSADFVASGTLPNGRGVILKTNGQVEVASFVPTNVSQNVPSSSEFVFNSGTTNYISSDIDPSDASKFIVSYRDYGNSDYGTACVGSISGSSITFGSEFVFISSAISSSLLKFDPANTGKFLILYSKSAGTPRYMAGTRSGNTLTFGAEAGATQGAMTYHDLSFDPNTSGKFIAAYRDSTNSTGNAHVGTVSGNTVTIASNNEYNFITSDVGSVAVAFDPNAANKCVIIFQHPNSSNDGKAIVTTISNYNPSFATASTFSTGSAESMNIKFDPNTANKFLISFKDGDNSNYGKAIVGTRSGNSITYGSIVTFNSGATDHASLAWDSSNSGKFAIAYRDGGNSNSGTVSTGSVSNTTISFNAKATFNANAVTNYNSLSFMPDGSARFLVTYVDYGNSLAGTAILGQSAVTLSLTNMTAANFLGTSTAAYTNGQTAKIMLQGGISTNQTGLTIGSTYYVQGNGTFATSPDSTYLVPSVVAGKAVSATTLLLKGI